MNNLLKICTITLLIIPVIICGDTDEAFLRDTGRVSPLKNSAAPSVQELQQTFHAIYNLYKESVVFINTEQTVYFNFGFPFSFQGWDDSPRTGRSRTFRGQGTGFIISKDGYICTNYHVVKKSDRVTVTIENKNYPAKVVGYDPFRDIALLKINGTGTFKPVYFGDSNRVRIGDLAIAIGNPYGLDKTYTFGIISATGRTSVDIEGNTHIQTDASINKGNSGGPLINIYGEVIGINRAILSRSGANTGIGFAIPINSAKKILVELKKHGRIIIGYIGIQVRPLSPAAAQQMGIAFKKQWYVHTIYRNSPAAKSGIQNGDVIEAIDDTPVTLYSDFIKKIRTEKIGKKIKIRVWRKGYTLFMYPVLQRMPAGGYDASIF